MTGATTPDNIWYLTGGDVYPGPHSTTAQQAGSIQAALSLRSLLTFNWETTADLEDETAMTFGSLGFNQESGWVYYYGTDSVWHPLNQPVPDPVAAVASATNAVSATSWANAPALPSIAMNIPRPMWAQVTLGAWVVASVGELRASFSVSGATTISEVASGSGWGQVIYINNGDSSTQQKSIQRTVYLNGGNNTIQARAYQTGGGTKQFNYPYMEVTPLRWA